MVNKLACIVKGYSRDTIASAIISLQQVGRTIQCNSSDGAIVAMTLNPTQPIILINKSQSQPHRVNSPLGIHAPQVGPVKT